MTKGKISFNDLHNSDQIIYEEYSFVEEYPIPKIDIQFFGFRCAVCNLPYEDDKYKRDVDEGFPLYYHKGEMYIQFCSCECGLKWKENENV